MRGKTKITAWLLAAALAIGCPAFVLGEEAENTSGGAISVPETSGISEEEHPVPPGEGQSETEEPSGPETPAEQDLPEEPAPSEEPLTVEEFSTDETFPAPKDEILHVIVPKALDFVIDPFEIAGRGQVYSEPQTIENRGDTDVLVTFSELSSSLKTKRRSRRWPRLSTNTHTRVRRARRYTFF
jgi:hypothetical protein